jgi:hypothetical protein
MNQDINVVQFVKNSYYGIKKIALVVVVIFDQNLEILKVALVVVVIFDQNLEILKVGVNLFNL